ncbi:MAG: hypothetical protein F7C08_01730 [Desulfurococcales archaeon]|nr:hypothetical protein [Desulfurococcales archaeon]MCE4605238.1 hypothetical protein [Desulfurococcales archaeon]
MRVKDALERIYRDFAEGRPRGVMLTILSILRLNSRREHTSPEAIAKEGRRIIRETKDKIDWGVAEDAYTREFVEDILRELADKGIVEELEPGNYRIKKEEDLVDEIYRKIGIIFSLRCC